MRADVLHVDDDDDDDDYDDDESDEVDDYDDVKDAHDYENDEVDDDEWRWLYDEDDNWAHLFYFFFMSYWFISWDSSIFDDLVADTARR